jgi:hypothetical protein
MWRDAQQQLRRELQDELDEVSIAHRRDRVVVAGPASRSGQA